MGTLPNSHAVRHSLTLRNLKIDMANRQYGAKIFGEIVNLDHNLILIPTMGRAEMVKSFRPTRTGLDVNRKLSSSLCYYALTERQVYN